MVVGRQFVVIAVGVGVVLVGGLVGLFLLWRGISEPQLMEAPATPTPLPLATPAPVVEDRPPLLQGVTLASSDAIVRDLARGLSSHPRFVAWLASEDLVRRAVASVENIANGKSPRAHLGFLAPKEGFKVLEKRGDYVTDPASYERYNLVAGIFAALDSQGLVELYRQLKPLIDEAYREIAPPERRFELALQRAIDHLQAVPVPERELYLKEKVVTYVYIDERLEALSDAQRHLLRMGPNNVEVIKRKLSEIEALLRASAGETPPAEASEP
jgi:hypothetical protein